MSKNSEQLELFPLDRSMIILKKLEHYSLPSFLKTYIDDLLDGRISETSLICCHSNCDACLNVVYNCLQSVKKELKKNG